MKHLRHILVAVLVGFAAGAHAAPVNTGHVQVELVPSAPSIAPGETIHVALRQNIQDGWHTYWRNPGDAGEPPQLAWSLPPGWKTGETVWPGPIKIPVGPLMDYGYHGEVYLPVPVTAPADAPVGKPVQLKADLSLLVCKEICIPEQATLSLELPVAEAGASSSSGPITRALAAAPQAAGLKGAMARQGETLKVAITGAPVAGGAIRDVYFFPYDSTLIKHAAPQVVDLGPEGLTLSLEPGYAFQSPTPPTSLAGALQVDGKLYEIEAPTAALPAAAAGLGPPSSAQASLGGGAGPSGLMLAAGFAFLGGLILNLMPCVFPILSMKAMALARHADGPRPGAQGLAFLGGVLVTFLGLALALVAAKAAGSAAGWGFQLQSPAVVAALCLVMLLIALNLSGVYEAGLSLQGAGGSAPSEGLAGSALTGVLAVVVAAPCTAPFMASAIAFALTQGTVSAMVVFTALGLGFAAPFVLLSFLPGLRRRLPRPGPWMDGLRKVLAFPMYGAAAWLAWVLTLQAGATALAALLAAGVVLALGAWLYGAAQRARAEARRPLALYALSGASAVAAAVVITGGLQTAAATAAPSASGPAAASKAGLPVTPFSPERLAELRGEGKLVFVDFTAAWCITCQVNKQVALSSPKVAEAFERAGAIYMQADWTKRDAVIARTLAEHGRAGVPLYLVYGQGGGRPAVLPQILTEGLVLEALEKAAAS